MDPYGERLGAQLRDAAGRRAQWHALAAELNALDGELVRHDARDDRVRRNERRAAKDLERLRGVSPRALVLRLFGRAGRIRADAEARLAEARAEQAACDAAREPLRQQRAALAAKQAHLDSAVQRHAELLQEKEQWLRQCRHAVVARLDEIRERIDTIAANRSALVEGLGATRLAATALQEAIDKVWETRAPGRVRHSDIAFNIAMNMIESRSRNLQADAHVDYAMRNVQALAAAVDKVRALGVIDLGDLARSSAVFSAGTGPEVDLLQLLADVRQIASTFERSDGALAEMHQKHVADRTSCIEGAS